MAFWLLILSVVLLLVIRQIALITARLEAVPVHHVADAGPEIGTDLSAEAMRILPTLGEGDTAVVLLSAGCLPCRELAPRLSDISADSRLIVLVAGAEESAGEIAASLPEHVEAVRDPRATKIAAFLELDAAPFALRSLDGVVRGKAYLHQIEDLQRLLTTTDLLHDTERTRERGRFVRN